MRGITWLFAGGRFANFKPIRPGYTITARARLIGIEVKSGKAIDRVVNQTGEVLYLNQHDEIVSRYEGDIFRIPRARSGAGLKYRDSNSAPKAPYRYSDEQIEEIATLYRDEFRRGSAVLYWEDVTIGESLPTVGTGPPTLRSEEHTSELQ